MIAGSRVECVFFGQSLARLSEIQCRSELRRTVGRPISELGSAGVEGLPSVHQWLRGWAFTVANAGRGSWTKKAVLLVGTAFSMPASRREHRCRR